MVAEVWSREVRGRSSLERWQNKIRATRRFLRGWAKNILGENRKKKRTLMEVLDVLDRKSETILLSPQEMEKKHYLSTELNKLLREEEIYWLQRSKATTLLQGDDNTKYFQLLASGRHRKTRIVQLEQEEGVIIGQNNLKNFITDYYKKLFGDPEANHFSLNEDIRDDILQVSAIENELLTESFTESEVKKAIFQMEHNKAPGPDGFPAEFFQCFWETINSDLMALFVDFHNGSLPLHSLNFGVITLSKETSFENTTFQTHLSVKC